MKELPVLGFNSGKYDINASKQFLLPYLVQQEAVRFTIKKLNNTMCLKTDHLNFLDITNYLAPGFSYSQFLKAFGCPQGKGFFPYEWVNSTDKLDYPALPPHEAFHSSLSNSNITQEEYHYCQRVWEENSMQSFREFLSWYNNLDVQPFVAAVEKMLQFWKDRDIDMFKDGVSVPGLTMKYLFNTIDDKSYFSLFNNANRDLYELFKDNNTGILTSCYSFFFLFPH